MDLEGYNRPITYTYCIGYKNWNTRLHIFAYMHQSIWFLHLSVQESAYMFIDFVYPNSVFVSGTQFHLICVSVCGQSVSLSQTKSVSVSITARHVEHCACLVPGLQRKQTFSGGTWYLFPLQTFEEKQTPEWEGRGFLSAGLHDVKQGLCSLSPCRTDTYRRREGKGGKTLPM